MTKKELELVKREFRDHLWNDISGEIDANTESFYDGWEFLLKKNDWKLIEPKIDWNIIKMYMDKIMDENEDDFIVEYSNCYENVMNYLINLMMNMKRLKIVDGKLEKY
jgi:hypothetical protein